MEVQSIEAHEYVSRENHRNVSIVHKNAVVLVLLIRLTRVNTEAVYCYYQGSPELTAPSRQSSAVSPAPSGLDEVHGANLNED